MGRTKLVAKNITFGYVGQLATALMSFILRTIFIHRLAETLLGVNALYSNILSLLSMAELGIGTALNFSLYAPVAKKDIEKVKSYMQMYRKAYHTIAIVVAVIGLSLTPFLKYLTKNPGDITPRDLTLYYLIFLFNTVSTYFVSYKYSLVNAEQKNYIQTNIITITKIITVFFQIIVLLVIPNFYLYLLTDAAVQLIQKIFVNSYLNKLYPYLADKDVTPLSRDEHDEVWKKTKALVMHKVGDVARLQTDTLIISSFIEVKVAGYVDNYTMVISTISNFVNIIFNSVISGFGNLIATESKEKQYKTFKVYRFFASWVYGFSACGFFIMIQPLIYLWIVRNKGPEWMLSSIAVYFLLTDYYFKGDRIVLSNYKTAAGVFEQDKYLALIQGFVNLVISIVLVQKIGLTGIYVGTVVSGLIANITKPIIIYRVCFDKSSLSYFMDSLKYILTEVSIIAVLYLLSTIVLKNITILSFALMIIIVTVVFNGVFWIIYHKTEEYEYLKGIVLRKLGKA
ncbi:lipopolysaccharide biosynthesis protein [Butyrivibrio sp. INlla16]|uniref:lipopolysaccharide biosynthesis protein n=1 Tax=Butyrivibrio sp. INlla16 TaxID=1520807 RepID=UPI0008847AFA|nr:polysaccharide biosynthesis protein [Butyrivibrio sp. INlla16]SDB47007.1 Membrane protein involved in the export of O-antigen and teichoic acid [Butyrivibrio sp. INlla16]